MEELVLAVQEEEREQGEESECTEEAQEAYGKKEQEVEGQWRRGSGALKFGFRVQGRRYRF